jgi:phosphate transport system permease protein
MCWAGALTGAASPGLSASPALGPAIQRWDVMLLLVIVMSLLILSATGYYLGRRQALTMAKGAPARLHSLPSYHGLFVALWTVLPPLIVLSLWLTFEGAVIDALVLHCLPVGRTGVEATHADLMLAHIRRLAVGNQFGQEANEALRAAGAH